MSLTHFQKRDFITCILRKGIETNGDDFDKNQRPKRNLKALGVIHPNVTKVLL